MPIAPSWIVSWLFLFFLRLYSAELSLTNMLRLCQIMPMFWSKCKVVAIFSVINRVPATIPAHNVFCYSAVAHIFTPLVTMAFGSKSGFKNKCRARAGFGLEVSGSGRIQASKWGPFTILRGSVCRGDKGRLKRYILHPPTVKIDWNHFGKLATLILGQMFFLQVRGYHWRIW